MAASSLSSSSSSSLSPRIQRVRSQSTLSVLERVPWSSSSSSSSSSTTTDPRRGALYRSVTLDSAPLALPRRRQAALSSRETLPCLRRTPRHVVVYCDSAECEAKVRQAVTDVLTGDRGYDHSIAATTIVDITTDEVSDDSTRPAANSSRGGGDTVLVRIGERHDATFASRFPLSAQFRAADAFCAWFSALASSVLSSSSSSSST